MFSTLQSNGDAYFLPECACNTTAASATLALNVLRLDGLLARYVTDRHLLELFSALEVPMANPDSDETDLEDEPVAREILRFLSGAYAEDTKAPNSVHSDQVVEAIQTNLTRALQDYRPTFRTGVPFFWVGFDEPGRAAMSADELRDALGICWDQGAVLVELQFLLQASSDATSLYYRPTAINSVNGPDGKGCRFMACASAEWPPNNAPKWHGTTAHLGKVDSPAEEPLDGLKELVRKPMPLDVEHLSAVRVVGVVRTTRPSDDQSTFSFTDRLIEHFELGGLSLDIV